jgi:glycosyltransferase involved in cell wall biosynthesis
MPLSGSFLGRIIWEQYMLGDYLKKYKIDVYHSLYQTLPFASKKIPSVVTIHDAIPWRFPFQRKQFSYRLYSDISKVSCKRASKFVTVSETTKVDFAPIYEIKPELIEVTYESINKIFKNKITKTENEAFVKKNEIKRKYILYVGGLKRHKNIRMLIKAFTLFKEAYDKKDEYDLYILGDIRRNMAISPYIYYRVEDLEKYVAAKKIKKYVRFFGKQSFEDLALFYKNAAVFISLSLYEGFGLPALEAISVGVPTILSNLGSFKEIIQDAGVYVYPYGAHRISDALNLVLTDNSVRKSLKENSVKVIPKYDRLHIARRMIEIYEEEYDDFKFK